MQKKQTGIGIVELMIAMLISTFLIGGMISLFTGNKRTYLYQQAQGMEAETQRFSSRVLSQLFHQVGHSTLTTASINGKHQVFPVRPGFNAGQVIYGTPAAGDQFESVTYRYAAGPDIVTCGGENFAERINTDNSPTNTISVTHRMETLTINNGSLVCIGRDIIDGEFEGDAETVFLVGDMAVPAAQQIEVMDLDFEYGLDLAGNDDAVDRYATATEVTAIDVSTIDVEPAEATILSSAWQRVKSVNVKMVVRTGLRLDSAGQTYEYSIELANLLETAQ